MECAQPLTHGFHINVDVDVSAIECGVKQRLNRFLVLLMEDCGKLLDHRPFEHIF